MIAYTSVYGHTGKAAELLAEKLRLGGCPKVVVHDLARCDMAQAVADAFRYGKLVLATTTYNADVFPFMRDLYRASDRAQLPEPHGGADRKRLLGAAGRQGDEGHVRKEQEHHLRWAPPVTHPFRAVR